MSIVDHSELTKIVETVVRENVEQTFSLPEVVDHIEGVLRAELLKTVTARISSMNLTPMLSSAISSYVANSAKSDLVNGVTEDQLQEFAKQAVQERVDKNIAGFLQDPNWLSNVTTVLKQAMVQRVLSEMSTIDVNQTIAREVRKYLVERHEQNIPNAGIVDKATSSQLTIMDDLVVVEGSLATRSLETIAEIKVGGSLKVEGNIILVGSLTLSDQARGNLVNETANEAVTIFCSERESSIRDRASKDAEELISSALRSVVRGGKLHHSITHSNLTEVGLLSKLSTSGETMLAKTAYVADQRVGINTTNPDMALSIWDDDVSMSIGKISTRTGFVGTTRAQKLVIGTNKKGAIEINEDGAVSIGTLMIGPTRVSFANTTPSWSGAKGEWAWNSNPAVNQPFAWQCLGGTRWQALRSA